MYSSINHLIIFKFVPIYHINENYEMYYLFYFPNTYTMMRERNCISYLFKRKTQPLALKLKIMIYLFFCLFFVVFKLRLFWGSLSLSLNKIFIFQLCYIYSIYLFIFNRILSPFEISIIMHFYKIINSGSVLLVLCVRGTSLKSVSFMAPSSFSLPSVSIPLRFPSCRQICTFQAISPISTFNILFIDSLLEMYWILKCIQCNIQWARSVL